MKNCNFFFIFYCIIISFGLFSCNTNTHNIFNGTDIEDVMNYMPVLNVQDSSIIQGIKIHKQIMVHYFNGSCSQCIAGLVEYERYTESFSDDNQLGLLFIAQTSDTIILNYYLIDKMHFKPVVLYDEHNLFIKWNRKYTNKGINTFLINSSGKILVGGDPLQNKNIDNKYRRRLGSNDYRTDVTNNK